MMKRNIFKKSWLVLFAAVFLLNGCGGGGGGGSDSPSSEAGTAGVAVDPYIQGAIFEEVATGGEVLQTSNASDSTGRFKFSKKVQQDSLIRMKSNRQGTHNGKPYLGKLKALGTDTDNPGSGLSVDAGGLVVSPMTTLLANGFTPEQVISMLSFAGISNVQESDLYRDPMAELTGLETVTDDELNLLQASIAINAFLLRLDNFAWGPDDEGDVAHLAESAEMVKICLNQNRKQQVATQLDSTLNGFGNPLTIDHLISASSNMVETITLAARNGEITDPVAETERLVDSLPELTLHYYVQQNRGDAAIEEAVSYEILPDISTAQYPQMDLSGAVTLDTNPVPVTEPEDEAPTESEPAVYPAPILQTVEVDGSNLVLSWTLPAGTSGVPSGGYDVIVNGTDTGTTWRTEKTSAVISGLQAGVEHSFHIQARWLQADPHQVPYSNELSGTIPASSSDVADPTGDAPLPPSPSFSGPVKAFPGAVGFGSETVAGRGGQIIKVTNLNDSGTGSLRAAIDASGPRIIVFEVGGVINLKSDLRISNGYVTIAGQTSPSPGIMLKGYGVRITASNVLMQHLAIRVGDDGRSADGSWDNADALQIIGNGSSNIVIDHCSMSWGIDENVSVWASNARNITFSNNIIGEGLMSSVHTEKPHSKGLLIGGASNNPKNVAIIGNLFAHNLDRNPQIKGGTSTFIANNLVYNYGGNPYTGYGSNLTTNYVSEKTLATFIGNVYIDGPDTPSSSYVIASNSTLTSDSKIYASDNHNMSRSSYLLNNSAKSFQASSAPVSLSDYVPLASGNVVDSVLTHVGSRPAQRDAVDARVVAEVYSGGGSRKDHSSGLWPHYPASSRSLDSYLPANPHGDDNGDGYTNIDHMLYEMARQVGQR